MADIMAMPSVRIGGDIDKALGIRRYALTEMANTRKLMGFQNLSQFHRRLNFDDGTVIECWAVGDQNFMNIYCPPMPVPEVPEELLAGVGCVFIFEYPLTMYAFDAQRMRFSKVPNSYFPYRGAADFCGLPPGEQDDSYYYGPNGDPDGYSFNHPYAGTHPPPVGTFLPYHRVELLSGNNAYRSDLYWVISRTRAPNTQSWATTIIRLLRKTDNSILFEQKVCGYVLDGLYPAVAYPDISKVSESYNVETGELTVTVKRAYERAYEGFEFGYITQDVWTIALDCTVAHTVQKDTYDGVDWECAWQVDAEVLMGDYVHNGCGYIRVEDEANVPYMTTGCHSVYSPTTQKWADAHMTYSISGWYQCPVVYSPYADSTQTRYLKYWGARVLSTWVPARGACHYTLSDIDYLKELSDYPESPNNQPFPIYSLSQAVFLDPNHCNVAYDTEWTWKNTLYVSPDVGETDPVFKPTNSLQLVWYERTVEHFPEGHPFNTPPKTDVTVKDWEPPTVSIGANDTFQLMSIRDHSELRFFKSQKVAGVWGDWIEITTELIAAFERTAQTAFNQYQFTGFAIAGPDGFGPPLV